MKTSWTVFTVFTCVVAVRHMFQLFFRSRREKGEHVSGYLTTSLLFACYVSIWVVTSVLMIRGVEMGACFIAGAAVFIFGVATRLVSIVTLGAFYSETIEIRENHSLVQHGIYSLIRHPLHLAFILELAGMALMAQSWWLAIPMAALIATVAVRNVTEDKKLEARFGDEFRSYALRIPSINLPLGVFRRLLSGRGGMRRAKTR